MTGTDESAKAQAPTAAEVEAAVRVLMRAWNPTVRLPGDPGYGQAPDEDEYDPDDGCQCAGSDEDGEPRGCNCGDGCSCDSCEYYRHRRHRTCEAGAVGSGTHCTREARYRVVAYRMQNTGFGVPRADGGICSHPEDSGCHCTAETVFMDSGPRPVTYWTTSACGVPHAQEIVAREQAWRGAVGGLEYYIETFTYEPHDQDLPEPLAALRRTTRTAADRTKWMARMVLHGRNAGLDGRLGSARRMIASAAFCAARPLVDEADWGEE